jgi:hypothetical protein
MLYINSIYTGALTLPTPGALHALMPKVSPPVSLTSSGGGSSAAKSTVDCRETIIISVEPRIAVIFCLVESGPIVYMHFSVTVCIYVYICMYLCMYFGFVTLIPDREACLNGHITI